MMPREQTILLAEATRAAIDAALVSSASDEWRPHLGASLLGRPCAREVWYRFRWCVGGVRDPRILRLFARGQREETVVADMLRAAGIRVVTTDPATGRQYSFADGHIGGSIDGAVKGVPEAPKEWHVLEVKTHSAKSFATLSKGVQAAHPAHWAQVQVYMHLSGMRWCLYVGACKDDDRLHIERIPYSSEDAERLMARGHSIAREYGTPPPGVSDDPAWYECAYCAARGLCYETEVPRPSCRTCAHATAEEDGWTCAYGGAARPLSAEEQRRGCDKHIYIPELLARFAGVVDASPEEGWVEYQVTIGAGGMLRNGPGGISSQEIHRCQDKAALGSLAVQEARRTFGATIVG